jgi:penicillin G amidase
VIHYAAPDFWACYRALPPEIQILADRGDNPAATSWPRRGRHPATGRPTPSANLLWRPRRLRAGGGIYYLNPGYSGIRIGRLTGLIRDTLASGKMTFEQMQRLQANNQMLDAQVFVPYLTKALLNARASGAPAALAALANDRGVADAVDRFAKWEFDTPTGIREGYDPAEDPANLPEPSAHDVQASISTTIYSVWRGQVLKNTIDATLGRVGLSQYLPDQELAVSALRNLLDNFTVNKGKRASGLNFFQVDGVPTPDAARDILLLRRVRNALDLLAGDAFAAAFAKSTNQDDYRWGKLHRIVFRHVMGNPFSIPAAGGFENMSLALAGVARPGGFEVPDASTHKVRAAVPNQFMFSSGPSRRFVAELAANGIHAAQIIPGGQCDILGGPAYANMLGRWLTNAYHPMPMSKKQVESDIAVDERFVP